MNIGEIIESYIHYRKSLGEKFTNSTKILKQFAEFVGRGNDVNGIDINTCNSFMLGKAGKLTVSWESRFSALNGLFEWAVCRGLAERIPLPKERPKLPEHMKPYIYSKEELVLIFKTALTYQKRKSSIPPICIQNILKLTYFLGLRLSETLSIKIDDIYFEEKYIYIPDTKFYKSRLVPFNEGVDKMLRNFINDTSNIRKASDEALLFSDYNGNAIKMNTVEQAFSRIRKQVNIERKDDGYFHPRIHDLRHTFAVNRLSSWYEEGKDVQKLLKHLSTYLGHSKLSDTSVYLTMTDEILDKANKLFEEYKNGKRTSK